MEPGIAGGIDNGRRARLALPGFEGEVGVRERGDVLELAWFGRPPTFSRPIDATLGGAAIRIVSVQHRELTPGAARRSGPTVRAITATAVSAERSG